MAKFRVLSLDGGGIRGLLTTLILERICQQSGLGRAFDSLDLIAGNSSGALIAVGMAHGLGQPAMVRTLAGIESAFQNGGALFGDRIPWWRGGWWLTSKYESEGRERSLKTLLGERTRFNQLSGHVMVTSFDLDNQGITDGKPGKRTWKPKIFHNLPPLPGQQTDGDLFAWQVAAYSTAALTYFPTIDGFVDGGLYANNPSMSALAQVFDPRYAPFEKPAMKDVLLLSIGAGQNLSFVEGDNHRWGALPWVLSGHPVALATDGMVGIADYECQRMLGPNYHRVAPAFPPGVEVAIDAVDRIDYMTAFVDQPEVREMIKECAAWLRDRWVPPVAQQPLVIPDKTSKHVNTQTELTCLLPIKPGFVETLDTRTFATRLRMLFKVLQGLRVAAREVRARRPIPDIVDAARTVHAFSWSIIAERQLMLSVTFDRPWEPYIRVIWKDLGPLMDMILCSCDGFVPSSEGHEAFVGFVRQHQIETGFFYPASRLTVDDQRYLAHFESVQRADDTDFDKKAGRMSAPGPEHEALRDRVQGGEAELREQWLAALDALFALRAVYPPGTPDETTLRRGVVAILEKSIPNDRPDTPAVRWFTESLAAAHAAALTNGAERRPLDLAAVQGGVAAPYNRVSHGCMLLARIDDAAGARKFVAWIRDRVTPGDKTDAKDRLNIAFTVSGLRQLGVNESDVMRFPKEFREGMEARAGLLGDVRENHPEGWALPAINVSCTVPKEDADPTVDFTEDHRPQEPAAAGNAPRARMSTVDVVMQLHQLDDDRTADWRDRVLGTRVKEICVTARKYGVHVLSVQPLRRLTKKRPPTDASSDSNGKAAYMAHDHFGFVDGLSQPKPTTDPTGRDDVSAGELFIGFANDRGDPDFPPRYASAEEWRSGTLIDGGSFLVVRKLRQNVKAFKDAVGKTGMAEKDILAKLVGREPDGKPLVTNPPKDPLKDNDFSYEDEKGELCPFHAHIRRGNPRLEIGEDARKRVPRIVRASLAYGPDYTPETADENRGMMFMAYNGSIAEQFEVIQRWMTGGNPPTQDGSTRVFSGQPDPLLGLSEQHHGRTYRFSDGGAVKRVELGTEAFVTLQWGLYLFVPSIAGLGILAKDPAPDVDFQQAVVQLGASVIERLVTEEDWAAVLEDLSMNLSGTTRAVIAAITAMHRGVMRTPYGVLVTQRDVAMNVLRGDPAFSVSEYQRRFTQSVGKSYLGMDSGAEYTAISTAPNRILMAFPEEDARDTARKYMAAELDKQLSESTPHEGFVTLALDRVVGVVLGQLAREWLDVPDGNFFHLGFPEGANDDKVYCPFHFLAPSRYVFSSPNPRNAVAALGQLHGRMVYQQAVALGQDQGRTFTGAISSQLRKEIDDPVRFAVELVGLVFGFVPPVHGNACQLFAAWMADESLWRVEQRYENAKRAYGDERAMATLKRDLELGMCAHPAPALLHRTATQPSGLGNVAVDEGDRIVICVAGVAGADIHGVTDPKAVFGGDRSRADHPTHSCPATTIAMGTLVGMFSAVFDLKNELVPSPLPLSIRVRV